MLPVKHILFPMDFSERCGATAPYVASMARRFGAKITLLNVVTPYWNVPSVEAAPIIVDIEGVRESMERDLSQSFTDDFAGLTVERSVEIGDPAEIITRFADTHAVDLVMMPTHGYGPFREFLLGSVTSKVLHDCTRPVWTSAHVQEPLPLIHVDVSTVLCAVDVASKSADLLKSAAQFAENIGAKLRLVHVVPGPSVWINPQLAIMFHDALLEEARHSIGELQKSFSLAAPLCVVIGDVAPAVREAAEQHRADLVIIGRGVMHERMGRLRTNAYAIIRQSPCPVLSL